MTSAEVSLLGKVIFFFVIQGRLFFFFLGKEVYVLTSFGLSTTYREFYEYSYISVGVDSPSELSVSSWCTVWPLMQNLVYYN